jgi:fibronectin-binding autotransporter adhesin
MLAMALALVAVALAFVGCGGGGSGPDETFDVTTAAELKAAFASITGSGDYLININAPLTVSESMTMNTAGANVTVKGASASTTITANVNGTFWTEAGKITFETITIKRGDGLQSSQSILAARGGTFVIKSGVTMTNSGNPDVNAVYVGFAGAFEMSGGTIEGFANGVATGSPGSPANGAKVTMSGGTITNGGTGISLWEYTSNSTVTVSGGTITTNQATIAHQGSGNTINITGGTFISGEGAGIFLQGSNAIVNISGGKITATQDGIACINPNDSKLTVTGGEITGPNGVVIYGDRNTVIISGGTITGATQYGIDVRSGSGNTVTKTRGTVTGARGPYNDDTGTATITGF